MQCGDAGKWQSRATGVLPGRQPMLDFTHAGPGIRAQKGGLLVYFRLLGEPHLPKESCAEPLGVIVYSDLQIQREGAAFSAGCLPVGYPVGIRDTRAFPAHHSEFSDRTHWYTFLGVDYLPPSKRHAKCIRACSGFVSP